MSNVMQNAQQRYVHVDLTNSEGILYVNSVKARSLRGLWWMYRHVRDIVKVARQAEGCVQFRLSLISYREFMLVSYWRTNADLQKAYKDPAHISMMRFTFRYPEALELANETFERPISTRYWNGRNGFAQLGQADEMTLEKFIARHGMRDDVRPDSVGSSSS